MSITKKNAEIQANNIVKQVLEDNIYLSKVLEGIKAKEDTIRYANAIALEILSEKNPEIIYSKWNFFVKLLKSKNAYHKSIAISTISNLTQIDRKKKFEEIFEQLFKLIDDKSVLVSRKLAIYAGRIAKAKPELITKITNVLLSINETQHNTSRKDLIKGDIVVSLSEYFEEIKEKKKILQFVQAQLNSSSPSTVKKAREFLSKWEK
ncbi:MAG: hypothetical protein JSV23_06725 [Promethearchaeota archaeon]|nr:MAG: hypothetical protein JSV23_06725 [Candidatus Lokiarchaeota archaeon]